MKFKNKNKKKPIVAGAAEVDKPEIENKPETEKVKNKKNKRKRSKAKVEENGVELESQPAKKPKKKEKTTQSLEEKNTDEETPQKKETVQPVKEKKVGEEKPNKKKKNQPAKEGINGGENQNTKVIPEKKKKNLIPWNNDLNKNVNKNDDSSIRKKLPLPNEIEAEREARTIFVGNLPVKFSKKKFDKLIRQYGEVDSIRIRGGIPECDKISKKVAVNKQMFNKDLNSLVAYVKFKTVDDAQKALAINGELFEERHLRVTLPTEKVSDKNKGIFVGNLRYKVTEEELWDFFKDCGEISSVRIIRDNKTGLCKGFGYVNFKSEDSVEFALKLEGETLQDREIRIKRLFSEGKLEKLKKKKQHTTIQINQPNKKFKTNPSNEKSSHNKFGFDKRFKSKTENANKKPNSEFKKKSLNKTDLKKKKLAEKLLAKSKKKPVAS